MEEQNSEEIRQFRADIFRNASYQGRVSTCLVRRMFQWIVDQPPFIPINRIVHEIDALEGIGGARSRTVAPRRFRGPILGRFMHKHFLDKGAIERSLLNQWFGPHALGEGLLNNELQAIFIDPKLKEDPESRKWL